MKLKSFIFAGALGTALLITNPAGVHALCSDDCDPDCYTVCMGNCIPGLPCYCNPNCYTSCVENCDDDGDGIKNKSDNCPLTANPSQFDCDQDGIGDACDADTVDADSDGVDDSCDNCQALANPDQHDYDSDGAGDACDDSPYGDHIKRLTSNTFQDDFPAVNAQGHVWWIQFSATSFKYLYYYNGSSSVQLGDIHKSWEGSSKEPNTTFERQGNTIEGNCIVYSKASKPGSYCYDYEIYLFDGQNETRITHNNYSDINPVICNGYIAWVGYPDDTGYNSDTKAEIFLYTPEATAVSMSSLKATPADRQVKLEWQTEAEIDNAGFNIWRAEGFHKINDSMIPAEGSPIMGADYDFFDRWVMNGKLYYYLVEDVDTDGASTFHGPVKALPRWIYNFGARD